MRAQRLENPPREFAPYGQAIPTRRRAWLLTLRDWLASLRRKNEALSDLELGDSFPAMFDS
jgi:hypothetical protein